MPYFVALVHLFVQYYIISIYRPLMRKKRFKRRKQMKKSRSYNHSNSYMLLVLTVLMLNTFWRALLVSVYRELIPYISI